MNSLGQLGEQRAATFFLQRQYRIVARNFRCRCGEIDLIVEQHGVLVFVEVRVRSRGQWGGAGESIHWQKQRRLRRAARVYLMQQAHAGPCRFDAILMTHPQGPLQWLQDILDFSGN